MIKVLAQKESWSNAVSLLVCETDFEGTITAVAKELMLHKITPGEFIGEPSVRLPLIAAQMLMDELWNCGLRPSEGSGSAGALAATQKHLDDMRRLVFKDAEKV